jgi:signal transduction histidine kinase/CheY-like chemotaxis protein
MPENIFKKIIRLGVKDNLRIEQIQRIRLTNILAIFVFFVYFSFIGYSLYFSEKVSGIMAATMCCITISAFLLNASAQYNAAKFLLFMSNSICLLIVKLIFNIDFSITAFYFPIIFCYAVFYDVKEQWKLFLPSFAGTVLLFVACFLIPANTYQVVQLSPAVLQFSIYLNYLLAFSLSMLIMLTVLSNYAQTQRILIAAREQAEAATRSQSVFISHMSHELRTPLNGIIGTAHLLQQETDSARQKEYFSVLHYSSKHILQLVNDLLDLSKIEAKKLALDIQPFHLKNALIDTAGVFKHPLSQKKLSYRINIDPRLEQWVMGDDLRLSQILNNLLSNALKFTTTGYVEFAAQLVEEKEAVLTVRFSVTDTGIGIKAAQQQKIFENFTQAETGTTRKFGGTGLGLSISKHLAGLFGSELEVKSSAGEGSEFFFTIRFETAVAMPMPTPAPPAPSLKGYRVLIAEDNPVNRLVAKNFLIKWGADFTETTNGVEALQCFRTEKYDLVLLDLDMPEMDGYAVAKEIRTTNKTIPIIAFTAALYENMASDLADKEFNGYVVKPFNPDDLFALMVHHIEQSKTSESK